MDPISLKRKENGLCAQVYVNTIKDTAF